MGSALRVDLGCGNVKRDGFVGIDQFAGPRVDYVLDLTTDVYPFPDESVDEVFSAHFLEHIESPDHVFSEISRICRDGARIEFWTPYAFTNEAFLYGHLHGITEAMWNHIGVAHRDEYIPMLKGRWQLERFVYVVDEVTINDLADHGVDLDFALRYFKGVVQEFGVVIQFRRDLSIAAATPERCHATSRFGEHHPLDAQSSGRVAAPARAARVTTRIRRLARKLRP
ncbi:MAG: methyltransferase domain-containing protein [Acidimicrobiia bacterium]